MRRDEAEAATGHHTAEAIVVAVLIVIAAIAAIRGGIGLLLG